MAGTKVTLRNMSAELCIKSAWRTARDLSYRVTAGDDFHFFAEKGSMVGNLLCGFVAPHSRFKIIAENYRDGTTDFILERSVNWVSSGILGTAKVKANFESLLAEMGARLTAEGAEVVARKEL